MVLCYNPLRSYADGNLCNAFTYAAQGPYMTGTGGEQSKIGGGEGVAQMFVTIKAIVHGHLGGSGGILPQNFGLLDSLRVLLKHS